MSVEQTCYKCHASLPQGKVFCPECGAPLIRVTIPEPAFSPATVSDTSVPAEISNVPKPKIVLPGKVDWTYGLPAATLAGVVASVLMVASRGGFGIGMVATGTLAVVFYRRRDPNANISIWMGAKLGLMSGLVAFAISAAFVAIVTLFSGMERLRAFLVEIVKQTLVFTSNPDSRQLFEQLLKPEDFRNLVLFYLFSFFVGFLLFSAIGGLMGATWMRFRRRP